jgi:hypothetical protein
MKYIFLALASVVSLAAFSQNCNCEEAKRKLLSYSTLNLCGEAFDSAAQEKLIRDFVVCNKDSVVMDQLHNKGEGFLFKKVANGVSLVEIDMKVENGKLVYPQNFQSTSILLVRDKLTVLKNTTPAKPIVRYLHTDFKKCRELYR